MNGNVHRKSNTIDAKFTIEQSEELERQFALTPMPSKSIKFIFAQKFNVEPLLIYKWFSSRRNKDRRKVRRLGKQGNTTDNNAMVPSTNSDESGAPTTLMTTHTTTNNKTNLTTTLFTTATTHTPAPVQFDRTMMYSSDKIDLLFDELLKPKQDPFDPFSDPLFNDLFGPM